MLLHFFLVVWLFSRSLDVICYDRWVLSENKKKYFKDQCLMISQPTFQILSIFWVVKMTILSKVRKLDTFESHNSWKLSFSNIRDFRSNRNICQSLLESYSPNILALSKTNSEDSVDSSNFSVRGYIPLIQNDSVTHMYGLGVYLNQGLLFMDSYLCFWLV